VAARSGRDLDAGDLEAFPRRFSREAVLAVARIVLSTRRSGGEKREGKE
jgi:hypothetical protein